MSDATATGGYSPQHRREIDYDTAFTILSNRRRRILLQTLLPKNTASVDSVAEAVTSYVDEGKRGVKVSLQQNHLPRLADAGVIEYDRQSETIRYDGHQFLDEALAHTETEDLTPG